MGLSIQALWAGRKWVRASFWNFGCHSGALPKATDKSLKTLPGAWPLLGTVCLMLKLRLPPPLPLPPPAPFRFLALSGALDLAVLSVALWYIIFEGRHLKTLVALPREPCDP